MHDTVPVKSILQLISRPRFNIKRGFGNLKQQPVGFPLGNGDSIG